MILKAMRPYITNDMSKCYNVHSIEDITPRVRLIRLSPNGEDTLPIDYTAGQYARLRFSTFDPRPFSIASLPGEELLEFYVTRGGNGVRDYMTNHLTIGERVSVDGPHGEMPELLGNDRPVLAISGGTGLVPLKVMIEQALTKGASQSITLYHGARNESELFHNDFLDALARDYPNFSYHIALSDVTRHNQYHTGLIHDVIDRNYDDLSDDDIFIGGPPAMISAILPVLIQKKATKDRIHTDRENLTPADLEVLDKAG